MHVSDRSLNDRGFDIGRDLGRSEVPLSPIHGRGPASRPPTTAPWKKLMALAVVGIMVLTGFAVLGQAVLKSAPAPAADEQPEPAKVLTGSREATYTIDHMFELYLKSHDPADLGKWNGTMGLNDWWTFREPLYWQYQARTTFPFVLVYNPYSTQTTPDINQGNSISTWYRQTIDAKNLTEIAAGPNLDPIFTPVLGPTDTAGAWMNVSWYSTYLENWELSAIRNGTHYANTYYGVAAATPRPASDDGYYNELQGTLTFNRAAASKILGLSGVGDLRTQFTANDTAITAAWFSDWVAEGGHGGAYDIYTAYDFSLAIQWLELSLDPTSTADNLVLRFWSLSWGNEILLTRYMEAANVIRYWQGWPDDWYLNITIGPDSGSVQSRAVIGYHMYATKDTLNNINGWALEARHIDRGGSYGMPPPGRWIPYNDYDPDQTEVTHVSWAPLTKNFGKPVSYAHAPLHWNLTSGEKFVVRLPTSKSLPGYFPQASTSDVSGPSKIAEMAGNVTWGEMVAGNGYPNSGATNLKSFYDKTTKTFTLVGPMNFDKNWNPAFPRLLETGAPMFVMNVVYNFTLSLQTGWNLVSLPVVGCGYKASTLGLNPGDIVAVWNPLTRSYRSHIVGVPVNDFDILPHVGYWINVPTGTRALTIFGVVPNTVQTITVKFPAGGGWMLIGFLGFKVRHASDIPGMWNGTGNISTVISTVSKYNPLTESYTSWLPAIPIINNFLLVPGHAYWILATGSGTLSYTP